MTARAGEAEYMDEPALAVMLCDLDASQYRVFSGISPLPQQFAASTMLVHADAQTPDLQELVAELAERTRERSLHGGLVASRRQPWQVAWSSHGQLPDLQVDGRGMIEGGISGVALGTEVVWAAKLAQGCHPIGPRRRITAAEGQVVTELDGQPALAMLLQDSQLPLDASLQARADLMALLRRTLICLELGEGEVAASWSEATSASGMTEVPALGVEEGGHRVHGPIESQARPIIGVDLARQGLALAGGNGAVRVGMEMTFCQRDLRTARRDLVRACTEVREMLEPASLSHDQIHARLDDEARSLAPAGRGVAGAIYFSCASRGGAYFGGPNAELQIVRRALGHVPLVGVFTAGEVSDRLLHTYAGVLFVFPS